MDRYCKGCSYKVIEKYDSNWGFCTYKDIIELCKNNYTNTDYSFEKYFSERYKRAPKDIIPSCQLVQTCF